MVYVRWYGKVVEGTVVNEHDKFGMMAVSILIQGVHSVALFHPDHVYNNVQAASYGANNKIVTQEKYEELKDQVREKLSQPAALDEEYEKLQKFKEQHWNHERNMLELGYWQEYDKMFHAYMRKRLGKEEPQQLTFEKIIIPSTPPPRPDAYNNFWIDALKVDRLVTKESYEVIKPRTIGKPYTVTELNLF